MEYRGYREKGKDKEWACVLGSEGKKIERRYAFTLQSLLPTFNSC